MQTAATDGIDGSTGSGRTAFEQSAATLPGVSAPSSVVRSIIRTASSNACSFDSFLIDRLASVAARSSSATASTEPIRGSLGSIGSSKPRARVEGAEAGAWAMAKVYAEGTRTGPSGNQAGREVAWTRWSRPDRGPARSRRRLRRRDPAAAGEGGRRRARADRPDRRLPALRRPLGRRRRRLRSRPGDGPVSAGAGRLAGRPGAGAGGRRRQVRRLRRRRRRRDLDPDLRREWPNVRAGDDRALRAGRPVGMRLDAVDRGTVLLPEGPQGLPRPRVHGAASAAA